MTGSSGANPFVGPRPLEPGETLYGRERELRELFYLLNSERVVVLHAPSGAGKSSLVQAGLLPRLQRSFDVWGPTRVNQEAGVEGVNRYVLSAALGFEEAVPASLRRTPNALAGQTLAEYFAGRPRRRSAPPETVLIFDQFEEVLTVDPLAVAAKEAFFDQLGELLRNPRVWSLFVLREDYLAPLDPYVQRVPTYLQNRFRIDLLGLAAAEEAMVEPARQAGREFPAAGQLVRDLSRVKVQQADGSFREQPGRHVEPVQLQVVCRRLWDEMPADDLSIGEQDIEQFGNVDEALGSYYASSVRRIADPLGRLETVPAAPRMGPPETARPEATRRRPLGVKLLALLDALAAVLLLIPAIFAILLSFHADSFPAFMVLVALTPSALYTWAGLGLWRRHRPARIVQTFTVTITWILLALSIILSSGVRPADVLLMGIDRNVSGGAILVALLFLVFSPAVAATAWMIDYLEKPRVAVLFAGRSSAAGHVRRPPNPLAYLAVFYVGFGVFPPATALLGSDVMSSLFSSQRPWADVLLWLYGISGVLLIRCGIGLWRLEASWRRPSILMAAVASSWCSLLVFRGMRGKNSDVFESGGLPDLHPLFLLLLPLSFTLLIAIVLGRLGRAWFSAGSAGSAGGTGAAGGELHRERAIRDWFDERLITAGGLRGQVLRESGSSGGLDNSWIAKLLDTHLVRAEKRAGATWYELAHDRLLVPVRQDNTAWQEAHLSILQRAAKLWAAGNRSPGLLLRGEELAAAERWAKENAAWLTADERDFLAASRGARRQARWRRRLALGASIVAVLALAAGWIARQQRQAAQDLTRLAVAESLRSAGQITLGNLVALEIRQPGEVPDGNATLERILAAGGMLAELELEGTELVHSPDLTCVLTRDADRKTSRLWGADTGELIATLPTEPILDASFSADGTRLMTASSSEMGETARIFDATTGAEIAVLKGWRRDLARLSTNGLHALGIRDEKVWIWDATNGERIAVLEGPVKRAYPAAFGIAAFSRDGRRVGTASHGGEARIWDAATGEQLAVLGRDPDTTYRDFDSLSFNRDGARILTVSDDTARLWDAASGELIAVLEEHVRASFNADGRRILTHNELTADRTVRLWDAASGEQIAALGQSSGAWFSPDGARVVTTEGAKAWTWDAVSGEQMAVLEGHTGGIDSASFSRDGSRIVTVSHDATARIWDAATGWEISSLSWSVQSIDGATFSADGARVWTLLGKTWGAFWRLLHPRRQVRIWGYAPPVVTSRSWFTGPISAAALEKDGARVVTLSDDGVRRSWDAATGDEILDPEAAGDSLPDPRRSPDGARVLEPNDRDGKKILIRDAATGEALTVLEEPTGAIESASFSPDGARVLTTSGVAARLWDAATGEQIVTLGQFTGTGADMAFSPDGTRVAIADDDTAWIWSLETGNRIHLLTGHRRAIAGVAFSPDGARVATAYNTASHDPRVRLWNAETGAAIADLEGPGGRVRELSFSPDGWHVLMRSKDGVAILVLTPDYPGYLQSRLRARTRVCLPHGVRVERLGERWYEAQYEEQACRTCVPVYFDHLGDAPDPEQYVGAWKVYRQCLDRER